MQNFGKNLQSWTTGRFWSTRYNFLLTLEGSHLYTIKREVKDQEYNDKVALDRKKNVCFRTKERFLVLQ